MSITLPNTPIPYFTAYLLDYHIIFMIRKLRMTAKNECRLGIYIEKCVDLNSNNKINVRNKRN